MLSFYLFVLSVANANVCKNQVDNCKKKTNKNKIRQFRDLRESPSECPTQKKTIILVESSPKQNNIIAKKKTFHFRSRSLTLKISSLSLLHFRKPLSFLLYYAAGALFLLLLVDDHVRGGLGPRYHLVADLGLGRTLTCCRSRRSGPVFLW